MMCFLTTFPTPSRQLSGLYDITTGAPSPFAAPLALCQGSRSDLLLNDLKGVLHAVIFPFLGIEQVCPSDCSIILLG